MHNRDIKQDRAQGTYAFTSYLSDIETNTAAVLKKKTLHFVLFLSLSEPFLSKQFFHQLTQSSIYLSSKLTFDIHQRH